jgi:anaerobic magnesium-protoporphyrin IX monomethyl ester cyclase
MRIYLLNAPFMDNFVRCGRWQGVAARGGTMYYPIWLSYATAVLEKEGHEVKLVDAIANKWTNEQTIDDAKKFDPDLIVVDSNFSSLRSDINITRILKQETESLSVLVGPPVSQYSNQILNSGIDIVAPFEYDFTLRDIVDLVEHEKNFGGLKGISYNVDGKIIHNAKREPINSEELDEIPFVSEVYRKYLCIDNYFLNHSLYPMVQIFTGRGCPNLCTFCSWPETLMGREYRTRSIENIVDEFEYIMNELSVKEIFIEDDSFTLNKKRIIRFCEELKERKIGIPWSCQSRATLDYDTMCAMKRAGCRLLDVGYESGTDSILKNIKKGTSISRLSEFTKNAKRAKLKILADFVIGFPGETKETAAQTVQFIKDIKPDILQIAVATPIPGTEFYNWCKDNNYLLVNDLEESIDANGFQKCIISYPWLKNDEIEQIVNEALKEYYLSFSYASLVARNLISRSALSELQVLCRSAKPFLKYISKIQ